MKKLLIVLLALACAFTMTSCGKYEFLDDFKKAIENTNPTAIDVQITSDTALGALNASFKTTYAEDGSFVIEGFYEKFNTSTEGNAEDVKTVVPVKITCDQNGNYSDGGAFSGSNPVATGKEIKLKRRMKPSVSPDGNILTATIKARKTKRLLGAAYPNDVTLIITKNEDKIISYTMEYATDYGYDRIVCNYQ